MNEQYLLTFRALGLLDDRYSDKHLNQIIFLLSGGKSYDKDHVVVLPESEERPSQQWEIELL